MVNLALSVGLDREMSLVEYINLVNSQTVSFRGFSGHSLVELLGVWNETTAPNVPRTESEHEENAVIARESKAEINRRFVYGRDYKELGNGSLWPVSGGLR